MDEKQLKGSSSSHQHFYHLFLIRVNKVIGDRRHSVGKKEIHTI